MTAAVGVLLIVGVLTWGSSAESGSPPTSTATSSTASIDTEPLTLPQRAGSYVALERAVADVTSITKPSGILDTAASAERLTAEQVSQAYGGAAAAALSYAMDGLDNPATAYAVRAPSPLLAALPAQDPERLGLAVPINEVVTEGDVRCLVNNGAVPAGQQPDPEQIRVQQCQRTGSDLTVVVFPSGDATAQQVASAVDDIWRSVSG